MSAACLEMELHRRQAAKSFRAFVPYVRDGYVVSEFFKRVAVALDKFILGVEAGVRPVLVFAAPPQHGKSELVSRLLPAYLLGRMPGCSIACTSYSADLARGMGASVQRVMDSDAYAAVFPKATLQDFKGQRTMNVFETPNGGNYKAVGRGGGLTGIKQDIIICDDIIKNSLEAQSELVKLATWEWFESVVQTRLSAKSGLLVMATQWNLDDFSCRVINKFKDTGRLTVLRFPAINLPDMTGYNPDLPEGPLVPELHPMEQLLEIKSSLSDYFFNAMFQSNPVSKDGQIFKQDGVQYYQPSDLPALANQVISVDATFKDAEHSDFVVMQVWGKTADNRYYMLDQARGRWSFSKTCDQLEHLIAKWPRAATRLVEDKANGSAIIDILSKKYQGVVAVNPLGGKISRAEAVEHIWQNKLVFLPARDCAPWVETLTAELLSFPLGQHDDCVDAMTQALNHMYRKTSIGSLLTHEMLKRTGVR